MLSLIRPEGAAGEIKSCDFSASGLHPPTQAELAWVVDSRCDIGTWRFEASEREVASIVDGASSFGLIPWGPCGSSGECSAWAEKECNDSRCLPVPNQPGQLSCWGCNRVKTLQFTKGESCFAQCDCRDGALTVIAVCG